MVGSSHALEGEALNKVLQCIPKTAFAITMVVAIAKTCHINTEMSCELLPE